ncbi:HPr kinase/phosphorylase [Yoonia sp. MH D7]
MKTLSADKFVHGSCVAVDGAAVLILGQSGAGKSALALTLMAFGARLVADDQVDLRLDGGRVVASAPAQIRGLVEARGVGVLNAECSDTAPLALVVDMDVEEHDRVPMSRWIAILGCELPLLHRVDGLHFGPAILQFLRAGRSDR